MSRRNDKSSSDQGDGGNEIATIYGDLITFIMCLFIILFVLSYNEQQDETFFIQMRMQFGAKELEQENVVTTEELLVSKVVGYIEKEKLEENARILVDEQKIKLILNPPILFDSGKARLKPEGVRILSGLATVFAQVQNPIIIEGHTDDVPINNAEFDSNWDLSFFRAYSVMKLFMNKLGFSPKQLSALGYGEYHPILPNDTVENRARNRRIEINVIRVTQAEALPE